MSILKQAPDTEPPGYEPNFVFGGQRIVSEASWPEYETQGVSNVIEALPDDDEKILRDELERQGRDYGAENILLGDAFDSETGRPLQHKPGIGVYITAEGVERYRRSHTTVLKLGNRNVVLRPGESIRIKPPHPDEQAAPDARPSADG